MEIRTQIARGGRLIVPAKMRKALQLETGDEVVLRLERGTLRLIPLYQAIKIAQEKVRKYTPKDVSLVDELIQARRAEAKHE